MKNIHISMVAVLLILTACNNTQQKTVVEVPKQSVEQSMEQQPIKNAVGQVAEHMFTEEDIDVEFSQMSDDFKEMKNNTAMRANILNNLMTRYALAEKAKKEGYADKAELAAKIRKLEQNILIQAMNEDVKAGMKATAEEVKQYYDTHQTEFTNPEKVHVRHILIRNAGDAKQRADKVLQKARKKPSSFEALAKEYSEDEFSKKNGGELAPFAKGRMEVTFEKAAFDLQKPGDVSQLVNTRFGYHIIQLIDRTQPYIKPLQEVEHQIEVKLQQQRFIDWVNQVKQEMKLEIMVDKYKHGGMQNTQPPKQ